MARSRPTRREGDGPAERLVVPYTPGTTSLLALREAAAGLCEIIWLVDLSDRRLVQGARLLTRLGTVVDVAGRSPAQVIDALAQLHPGGAMTVTDSSMVLLAEVAAALDLPFHSPVVAERLSDKQVQREALRRAGVAVPPFWSIPAAPGRAEVENLATGIRLPAVLKPRRGDGSRRVQPIREIGELVDAIGDPERLSAEPAGWMVEGYLDGDARRRSRFADIVSVESFLADGAVHHLTVTGRLPFAEPFRETGSVLPSDVSAADAAAARAVASAAVTGLGLEHGCVHTEVKFTSEGPCIVEVNGRIGGGIPELLALAGCDIGLLRFGMERALGRPVSVDLPLRPARVAYRRIVPPPVWARRITAMSGQQDLPSLPGVAEVAVNRRPGDLVDWQLGLDGYVYSVYGTADSYEEVEAVCRRIDRTVRIDYEELPPPGPGPRRPPGFGRGSRRPAGLGRMAH